MTEYLGIFAAITSGGALISCVTLLILARQSAKRQKLLHGLVSAAHDERQLRDAKSALDASLSLAIMMAEQGQESQIPTTARRLTMTEDVKLVDEKHPGGAAAFLADRLASKRS